MIVDASAIVAILGREPEADRLSTRLRAAPRRSTHPISIYEAVLAVERLTRGTADRARALVDDFMSDLDVEVLGIGSAEAAAATDAFARYGKGRHPASLNMGDCFSYAVAKLRGAPLLYKGDDFALTDLA